MQDENQLELVKILGEFKNDDGSSSMEGLRATSLGNGLYEIKVIPIMTEGYHLFDVVRCKEFPNEDHCPVVTELVKRSAQQTVGIIFPQDIDNEQKADVLWSLQQQATVNFDFLRISKTHCAISFHISDSDKIFSLLKATQEKEKIQSYETLD